MGEIATIRTQLSEKVKERFIKVATPEDWERESSFALQHIARSKKLQDCTQASLMESVMNVANIGLTLNPASKQAYLIPRWDSSLRTTICVLEPSYQGLIKLIGDTGAVKAIYAHPVYRQDEFEVSMGTEAQIIHKPKFGNLRDGDIVNFYAVAILEDGTKQFEVMTREQIDEIMNKSESHKAYKAEKTKSSIWKDWYAEMGRKTVIRRLIKYLPKSDHWRKVEQAIELQENDYKPSDQAIDFALHLIPTSTFSPEQKEAWEREVEMMNSTEIGELIEKLKENQVDPVSAGNITKMGQIHDKLDQHTRS